MKKIWWIGVLTALALAGCEEQPRSSHWGTPPPALGEEQPPARIDSTFMQGEWTLATMGTYGPDKGTPAIKVNITADRIEATSDCKQYAWTYALTERGFETAKAAGPAGCERKGSIWERAFEETISRARRAEMQGDGSIVIKGAGGELELR